MKNMRLKLARVEMNLSQEELAAKVNVTRPTIAYPPDTLSLTGLHFSPVEIIGHCG